MTVTPPCSWRRLGRRDSSRFLAPITLSAALCVLCDGSAVAAPPSGAEREPAADEHAEDEELDVDEDFGALLNTEIVSTASRAAEDADTAPATVTVITAEEMRLLGITTVAEAVNYFGLGMTVQQDGGQEGSIASTSRGVGVAGDGGNHMLLQLNGHAMNDPWGGWAYLDDFNSIPIEVVDRIEIINGPGSVLYGTSAMYGVINVVTKSADAQAGIGATLQGHGAAPGDEDNALTAPRAGHRLGWGTRARLGFALPFAVGDKHGEFFVQLMRVDRQRPTHVYGPQPADWDPGPNSYPSGEWGGIASTRRSTTGGVLGFRLGGWALDLQGGLAQRTHLSDYQADFADPENQESNAEAHLDLRNRSTLRAGMRLNSRLFGDYGKYRGSWIYSTPDWCSGLSVRCNVYQSTQQGRFGVEEVFEADWFVDGKVVTTIGGDLRGRVVSDQGAYAEYDSGAEPLGDSVRYLAVTAAGALFVQQRYTPVDWFGLNLGLRLDMDQLFGAHLSPRAVAAFMPAAGTVLKLIYSEAFRAPLAGELFYSDPVAQISASSLGGLDAEVTRSGEFAFEQRLPRGIGSLRAGAYVGWYGNLVGARTATADEVEQAISDGSLFDSVDPSYVLTYANIGQVLTYGGYLGAQLQTRNRRFRFGTNVQAGDSQLTQDLDGEIVRSAVPIAPQVVANAHAMLVWGGAIPRLSLAALYHSPRQSNEAVNGAFVDVTPNRAGHQVQGRLALTGEVEAAGLEWSVWTDYSVGRRGPYQVGQLNYSDGMAFAGELTPLDRLSVWAGLQWQFDVVAAARKRREQGAQ